MSGIYISGMEMPKSCSDCPCSDLYNDEYECAVCGISKKPIPWKWANSHGIDVIYLRPTDCPLISVPTPHGRLIDADELKQKMHYDAFDWLVLDESDVDDAPTIIESEE